VTQLALATAAGVVLVGASSWPAAAFDHALVGIDLSAITRSGSTLIAGGRGGIYIRRRGRTTWDQPLGMSDKYVRWLAADPMGSGLVFAGLEPAEIWRSEDAGLSWQPAGQVADLRDQFEWWLPYSPEAGCVRGFAQHGKRLYAAVEVGGLLVSDDSGQRWALVGGSTGIPKFESPGADQIHADVHDVAVHPSSKDVVTGFTNGGTYASMDGGRTWSHINNEGYTRSGWLDPQDRAHLLIGPARSVGRGGRLRESRDGGRTWSDASQGLDMPWADDMVERFIDLGDRLVAISDRGAVFVSPKDEWAWASLAPDLPPVRAAVMIPARQD
jgi:photosystem II stability/assembly factor-like uncharacterized protein